MSWARLFLCPYFCFFCLKIIEYTSITGPITTYPGSRSEKISFWSKHSYIWKQAAWIKPFSSYMWPVKMRKPTSFCSPAEWNLWENHCLFRSVGCWILIAVPVPSTDILHSQGVVSLWFVLLVLLLLLATYFIGWSKLPTVSVSITWHVLLIFLIIHSNQYIIKINYCTWVFSLSTRV
jgi:hypothetical protein